MKRNIRRMYLFCHFNVMFSHSIFISHFYFVQAFSSSFFLIVVILFSETFCRFCYIQHFERFNDVDISEDPSISGLNYEFRGSHQIYSGFADKEMGSTDHIDFFRCVYWMMTRL